MLTAWQNFASIATAKRAEHGFRQAALNRSRRMTTRMDRPRAMIDRTTRATLSVLLALLAAYGLWSTPGLAIRWGFSPEGVALLAAWGAAAAWALSTMIAPPRRAAWCAFTALAVAVRLASATLADGRLSSGDSHWYVVLARGVLAGRGLVMDEPYMGIAVRGFYPPAYPLLLAGWGALAGFSTLSLLVFSTLIDAAAAWLIVRIADLLDVRRAGVAAAALYLIWPAEILSAPLAQKEGLCAVFALALALGWLKARERAWTGWRGALAIGLPAAGLALTQPGQAPLAAMFGLVLLPTLGWRRLLALGIPAAAVAAAAMLPWWARNYLVFGAFIPLTTASGLSLWIGNNPRATGGWMPYPPQLRGLGEIAYARAASGIARDWIVHHPLDFLRLTATKFVRAVAIGQSGVERLAAMTPAPPRYVVALLFPLTQTAHLLALGGGAAALRIRRDPAIATLAALLLAGMLQLMLFGVWFEFEERHRQFLTPFLLLATALAVDRYARSAGAGPLVAAPDSAARN